MEWITEEQERLEYGAGSRGAQASDKRQARSGGGPAGEAEQERRCQRDDGKAATVGRDVQRVRRRAEGRAAGERLKAG